MLRRRTGHFLTGTILTALVFAALLAALCIGGRQVVLHSGKAGAATLEKSVRRAAVLCYAVEGRYPQSVDELVQRYGLVYDESAYIVHMDAFADNILPDISVLPAGGDRDG